jgi:DinB family protein
VSLLAVIMTGADDSAMSDFYPSEGGRTTDPLPQLAAEDHTCSACALAYSEIPVEHAAAVIQAIPAAIRDAVFAVPEHARRERPDPRVWSVTEYVCHLRDVYATYTIRLHRARTEERPALEPMLNDLRARRFRYNERDVVAILDEVAANAAGFCEEIASAGPQDWDRVATRRPGEQRTARWLVRQAMHEGVHHLADIRTVGTAAGTSATEP